MAYLKIPLDAIKPHGGIRFQFALVGLKAIGREPLQSWTDTFECTGRISTTRIGRDVPGSVSVLQSGPGKSLRNVEPCQPRTRSHVRLVAVQTRRPSDAGRGSRSPYHVLFHVSTCPLRLWLGNRRHLSELLYLCDFCCSRTSKASTSNSGQCFKQQIKLVAAAL
ncbi:hypothetical protein BD413DRAFT_102636 [Trametes elegans]|nr:hypothetical protein BD413DRAFT_102636 [Trametes elegans]